MPAEKTIDASLDAQNKQNKEIAKTMGDLKTALQERDDAFKKQSAKLDEAVANVHKFETKLSDLNKQLEEDKAMYEKKFMQSQRLGYGSGAKEEAISIGQAVVKSEAYERMLLSGDGMSGVNIGSTFNATEVESFKFADGTAEKLIENHPHYAKQMAKFKQNKALSSDGTAGLLIDPLRLPGIVGKIFRATHIRDLMSATPTTAGSLEWIQYTGFVGVETKLTSDAASGQADIVVANISGFAEGQKVKLNNGTASEELTVAAGGIARSGDGGTITFSANLANVYTVANGVVTSDGIAPTPETRLKPDSNVAFEIMNESFQTIALGLPVTRQIWEDATRLASYVDNHLIEAMKQNEDMQLLYGPGGTGNLNGILKHPDRQIHQKSSVAGDNDYDAIRRTLTKVRLTEISANVAVLNPAQIENLELMKSTDKQYLSILNDGKVWQLPFIDTTAINEGQGLVTNFGLAVELYDREQTNVRIAENHKDFFMRNMIQLLIEQRLQMAYWRPEAIGDIRFDQ